MKHRLVEIDILKGICIFLMVFDHVEWGEICHTYVQSFHMPIFFLASGYLYKKTSVKEELKKRIRSLMIPYFIFSSLYLVLIMIGGTTRAALLNALKAIFVYPTDMNSMPMAPALWFLPCMFITDIVYTTITQVSSRKTASGCIVLLSAPIIFYSQTSDKMLPFCLEPFAFAIIFWLTGDLIKLYNKKLTINILITIAAILLEAKLAFMNGSVDMRSARYHNIFLFFFDSILGMIGLYGVSIILSKNECKLTKLVQGFFSYLSINAMVFLCTNQLFIRLYNSKILPYLLGKVGFYASKSVVFFLTILSCFLLGKFIKLCRLGVILGERKIPSDIKKMQI